MVRGTKISHKFLYKELTGNPEAKDYLLCETYGLTLEELVWIRKGNNFERIVKSARVLKSHHLDDQINSIILPALAFGDWENPGRYIGKVKWVMINMYGDESKKRSEEFNSKIPCIQILREEIGSYHGNLYEARKLWKNFVAGDQDWTRAITLPLTIDKAAAELLGIYWGDGFLKYQYGSKACTAFCISGNKRDLDLYNLRIIPLIKKVHNLGVAIKWLAPHNHRAIIGQHSFTPDPDYKQPYIQIGSQAIATWLKDDLNFSPNKENVKLPDYKNWPREIVAALFKGILATMGSIDTSHNVTLHETDEVFIKEILLLSNFLGYKPRFVEQKHTQTELLSRHLDFPLADVNRMRAERLFTNPNHQRILRERPVRWSKKKSSSDKTPSYHPRSSLIYPMRSLRERATLRLSHVSGAEYVVSISLEGIIVSQENIKLRKSAQDEIMMCYRNEIAKGKYDDALVIASIEEAQQKKKRREERQAKIMEE